jgi:hypothetical protein
LSWPQPSSGSGSVGSGGVGGSSPICHLLGPPPEAGEPIDALIGALGVGQQVAEDQALPDHRHALPLAIGFGQLEEADQRSTLR